MITKREIIGAQGEISIFRCEGQIPDGLGPLTDLDRHGRPIISHSEKGHHHILDREVAVMEKLDAPAGMRVLYALLIEPTNLIQDATDAHGSHALAAGLYEFRVAREYDPFTEQARMVAD